MVLQVDCGGNIRNIDNFGIVGKISNVGFVDRLWRHEKCRSLNFGNNFGIVGKLDKVSNDGALG